MTSDANKGRRMGFHHMAIATRDLEASHRFYTEAMGFELVKTVVAPTPEGAGWARHLFYDAGDNGMLAIWDLHDDEHIPPDFSPAISTGLGLPSWVNHVAFNATDLDDLHRRRDHWLSLGYDAAEIDHGWCTSVYTNDPNGIMVEFCTTTRTFGAHDRAEAAELLAASEPPLEAPPDVQFFEARDHQATAR
jgi:catechol 2,3-dioxygenase-like lactoylglutathione lyase family enzyme